MQLRQPGAEETEEELLASMLLSSLARAISLLFSHLFSFFFPFSCQLGKSSSPAGSFCSEPAHLQLNMVMIAFF